MNRHKCRWNCDWSKLFRIYLSLFLIFSFLFYIFIHFNPRYGPNFKSLAHREVSLKSITKFRPERRTRKRVNKNMVKRHPNSYPNPGEIYFVLHPESARLQKTRNGTQRESLHFAYSRSTWKISFNVAMIKVMKRI